MTDQEQWADNYFYLGRQKGYSEGVYFGLFWGWIAGLATYFFVSLWR